MPLPIPANSTDKSLCALFVSTSLDTWETHTPDNYAKDTVFNETPHHKLDPTYYAWLRNRMNRIKARLDRGKFPQDSFDAIREKFNRIHVWAVAQFGEAALVNAVHEFDRSKFQPPKPVNTDCFQGIKELPMDQQDWPLALRDIFSEIVRDLTGHGVSHEECIQVAQDIVITLVGTKQAITAQNPVQAALPL